MHTFTMNPQERSLRLPFCQFVALEEPRRSPFVSSLPNEVVIRRRIRGREPVLNLASQLVTYEILSVSAMKDGEKNNERFILFISFNT